MWGAEMGANEAGFAVVFVVVGLVLVVVTVGVGVVAVNVFVVVWAMAVDVVVDDYNDQAGVVIGNEAVWNRLSGPQDLEPRLLGMDLLR